MMVHHHTMISILKRDSECPALPACLHGMYRHSRPEGWSRFCGLFRFLPPEGCPARGAERAKEGAVVTEVVCGQRITGGLPAGPPVAHATGPPAPLLPDRAGSAEIGVSRHPSIRPAPKASSVAYGARLGAVGISTMPWSGCSPGATTSIASTAQ